MSWHQFPKLLEEYYVQKLRATRDFRKVWLDGVFTAADAAAYRARVRRVIARAFGPLPPRTPLRARTLKTTDFGEYAVEHVLYESRPRFLVSANLYLPAGKQGAKPPAVLFTCGHSHDGKAYPRYASTCVRLVRAGFAVLCYDPVNQGERELYTLLDPPKDLLRTSPCKGHNIVGKQLGAAGEWFGAWRLWDGIRGVDYLEGRPDVDTTSLAVVGQSGGGTMSAYLWAMDRRIKMVASSCWATSYLLDIENGMPADSEQYPPGLLAAGLDKLDFFIARAGEPALLLGQEQDFFDDRGLKAGHAELLKMHLLLGGSPSLCRLSMDAGVHALDTAGQVALVDFFSRALGRGPVTDRSVRPPSEGRLKVTPRCNVNRFGSRPMYEMVSELAVRCGRSRGRVAPAALPAAIRKALAVKPLSGTPHHRRLFHTACDRKGARQKIYRFILESEPGIQCVLRHVCSGKTPFRMDPDREISLFLPNIGSQEELDLKTVPGKGRNSWILDVRGTGESAISPDDVFSHYGHDYMYAGHALMYGGTLLGDRLFDVLSAVRLLRSEGARTIHLIGRGQGAILALLAGCMDRRIATVTSLAAPESILAMCRTPINTWPTAVFPVGVLKHFDLPDLRRALGRRLIRNTLADAGLFKA